MSVLRPRLVVQGDLRFVQLRCEKAHSTDQTPKTIRLPGGVAEDEPVPQGALRDHKARRGFRQSAVEVYIRSGGAKGDRYEDWFVFVQRPVEYVIHVQARPGRSIVTKQ